MKRVKHIALALVLVLSMSVLSGCGGMKPEDAKAYVQAVMDASYKGEFKAYMEQTKSTEEEAKKMYDGNIDETMKVAGFGDLGLSEELTANYKQLFADMAKQANYTVGEATETDDGFQVEVKVQAYTALENLEQEFTDVLNAEVDNIVASMSEQELNEFAFQKMYELMSDKLANPTYGEEKVVVVHVVVDSDNVWSIPDADMTAVDQALFPE